MKLYTFLNNKLNKIKEETNNKNNKYNQKSLALLSSVIEENNKIKNKFNKSKTKKKESEIKLDKENANEKDGKEENNSNNEKISRNKINLKDKNKDKNKNMKKNSFKSNKKTDNNVYNSPSLEKKQSKDSNKIQPKEKEKEKDKNNKKLSKYPSSVRELSPKNNASNIFISNLHQQKKNDNLWSNRSFNKFNEKSKSSIESVRKAQNHHGTISEKKKSKHIFISMNQKNKYKNQSDLIEIYNDLLMKNKSNADTLNIFDDDNNEQISKDKLNTRVINLNNLLEI
jgi:hypothetical protein